MSLIKKRVYGVTAIFVLVLSFYFSTKATSGEVAGPVSEVGLVNNQIVFRENSKLLSKLKVAPVSELPGSQKCFKTVGQIILLANTSTIPGDSIDWVELDPELTHALTSQDLSDAEVGDAYGLVQIPAVAETSKIQKGSKIFIDRYGIEQTASFTSEGMVLNVVPDTAGSSMNITFKIKGGRTWLPGTNCDVNFPVASGQVVSVLTTALLHEGVYEYVLKELKVGQFVPQKVTMGEGTPDRVAIVDGLKPGERIIVRGSVLLKPLLHELLGKNDQ